MAYESDEEIWKHHFYHSYNKPKKKKKPDSQKTKQTVNTDSKY